MIHESWGNHNQESPYMIENKCSKRYPRTMFIDTIIDNDGYPLYCHRSAKDNGRTIILKVKKRTLYSPTAGLFRIHRCFLKHSKHIALLSTAILLSPSCTFTSTSRKETIWLYLVLQLLMPTMKFRNIRWEDISAAMRRIGESFCSPYTNDLFTYIPGEWITGLFQGSKRSAES